MLEEAKVACKEILRLMVKHKNLIKFDVDDFAKTAECHKFGLELKYKYGYNIDPKSIYSLDWQSLKNNNIKLASFCKSSRRTISNSIEQPKNETLIVFEYPTGAYIFGGIPLAGEHPRMIFNDFFNELKGYNPKYVDNLNSCLYFTLEGGAEVYNKYEEIFNKYVKRSSKYMKEQKILGLKKELQELE